MSDIQLYLLEYEKNKAETQRIAAESAAKLESKKLKLVDLITDLEPYINDKSDGSVRARTLSYLADVLAKVPTKVLSGQERRLLLDFILARLETDLEGIAASAKILIVLERLGKWDHDTARRVMQSLLIHTHPLRQFKLQTERFAIIEVFDALIGQYREPLKQVMENDVTLMTKLSSYFEGEKDPRNLMIIFSVLHVPMAEWNIQHAAQDFFEAVFNYFPITFTPPPDGPYGITAQDLKDRLRQCIAATAYFAPYAFPALLDKLDSTSINTKRDVLQTLQACIANYGPATVNLYSVSLWDALKFEVFNVQEEDLAEESLKTLAAIAKCVAENEAAVKVYLGQVIKECNQHLHDAPTKQSQGAGRIIYAVASSAAPVADRLSKGIAPVLFSLYQASDSITKRRGLLEIFNQLLKSYSQAHGSGTDVDSLRSITSEAIQVLIRALASAPKAEVSFRLTALEGLTLMTAIPGLLSEDAIRQTVDSVTEIVLHEHIDGHGDIHAEAVEALRKLSKHVPQTVCDRTVPAFMAELPDNPGDEAQWAPALKALAQLSAEKEVFGTVVLRIRNKSVAARHHNAPQAYQYALLLALLYAFTFGSPTQEDGVVREKYFTEYAAPLIDLIAKQPPNELDAPTLEATGRLCNLLLRQQSTHFQASVYNRNIEWITPTKHHNAMTHVNALTPFFLYYYAALKPEVPEAIDIATLLQIQAQITLNSSGGTTRQNLQLISLLINKFIDPAGITSTLTSAQIEVTSLLQNQSNVHATSIAFAVVKALLIHGKYPNLTKTYLDLLLQNLPIASKSVARKFSALLAPEDILTKENHCVVSRLYKQKTFSHLVPTFITAIRTTTDVAGKMNYIIALSGILRWLSYTVLQTSLPSLAQPLLQSLDLADPEDQDVKTSTLTIFEALLLQDPDIIAEHAASLITRLLNCTATVNTVSGDSNEGNSAAVRAKALQCLALVPRQLRRETVVPYRRKVVKQLLSSLDDPRRNVRAEAVKCRRAWLKLEDEEGDGGEE